MIHNDMLLTGRGYNVPIRMNHHSHDWGKSDLLQTIQSAGHVARWPLPLRQGVQWPWANHQKQRDFGGEKALKLEGQRVVQIQFQLQQGTRWKIKCIQESAKYKLSGFSTFSHWYPKKSIHQFPAYTANMSKNGQKARGRRCKSPTHPKSFAACRCGSLF